MSRELPVLIVNMHLWRVREWEYLYYAQIARTQNKQSILRYAQNVLHLA